MYVAIYTFSIVKPKSFIVQYSMTILSGDYKYLNNKSYYVFCQIYTNPNMLKMSIMQ